MTYRFSRRGFCGLLLLCVTAASAQDEAVDLVPRWRKGDVCEHKISTTVRVRGTLKAGRARRAFKVELDKQATRRDKVLSTNEQGLPARIEREYRRLFTTTVTKISGKTNTKKEIDPSQGTTRTLDESRDRPFLVEVLERAIIRKAVRVGDTWTWKEKGAARDLGVSELTCKLSEVLTYKGQRTARVHITLKFKGDLGTQGFEATVRGHVYFSLDAGRIIRSYLKGPVTMKMDGFGPVRGTIREESTLVMVKAGKEANAERR